MRNLTSLLFAAGMAFFLITITSGFDFGNPPMRVGEKILSVAPDEVGAANIVTAVVLAYRGIDTLIELAILFTAATAAGLVLGRKGQSNISRPDGGFILLSGADLVFPLLLVVGFYIILHGHLTPGGGFQGGVILAAAFFLPLLARPRESLNTNTIHLIEGLSGATFILIGLAAMFIGDEFLQPLFIQGGLGEMVSAGTLPLLYLAVGLKVGSELAGLLAYMSHVEMETP